MIGLKVCIKAAQGQFFLQVSVKSERVLLSYQDADLLILGVKVPQNTLSHTFKSTLDEAIGYNHTINKGLEASRYVEIADFKPHIPSSQIYWHESFLDVVHGFGSRTRREIVLH